VSDGAKLYLDSDKGCANVMAAASFSLLNSQECQLSPAYEEERWYAAYTCANHEKRVAAQLDARAVEHFVPLYNSVRRWKDRRIHLALPLFQAMSSCDWPCATSFACFKSPVLFTWLVSTVNPRRYRMKRWKLCARV